MAFGDAISKILIDVRAETKGARANLHELNGAIEAVGKVTQFAAEAMQEYGDHLRLSTASSGINIKQLSQSFKGLVKEHDLLTFAVQSQNGVLRLNQGEMNTVAQAAVALRNRGFDLEEAIKKLTDAAVKGKVGGLDDFGLSIKEGGSRAQTTANLMAGLTQVIKESGSAGDDAADDIKRLAREWDDALAAAKRYTVEAIKAISVDGMLDEAYNKLARREGKNDFFGGTEVVQTPTSLALKELDRAKARISQDVTRRNLAGGIGKGKQNVLDSQVIEMDAMDLTGDLAKRREAAQKSAEKLTEEYNKLAQSLLGVESATQRAIRVGQEMRDGQAAELELISRIESENSLAGMGRYNLEVEQLNALVEQGKISWDAYATARQKAFASAGGEGGYDGTDYEATVERIRQAKDETQKLLAEIQQASEQRITGRTNSRQDAVFGAHVVFGAVEDWDPYLVMFDTLGSAAGAFGEAVGASYEAIVTGQGGVSAAFKRVMADGLMAIGKSSVVEALRETALGFGSLALGPLGGASAAMHFKAAALHGAVAVAAGLAANAMGTSAQVAASEKAADDKAKAEEQAKKDQEKKDKGGNTGRGSNGRDVIVAYLDPFANQPEHMRREQARAMVQNVMGSGAVENS